MKKNYFILRKTSMVFKAFIVLLVFCANHVVAQSALPSTDTFVWKGTKSSDWADKDNWTILRGTTAPGSNNYPGEIETVDLVIINKSDTPFPPILDNQVLDIARLNITNAFGSIGGATLTINANATLNVGNRAAQSNQVILNGGNIINNGALNIVALGVGSTGFPVYGISASNPTVLPDVPTQYGYSGTGTLKIDLVAANFAGASAIVVLGNNNDVKRADGTIITTPETTKNVTYRFELNNPEINLNQGITVAANSIHAVRVAGGNNANKMIIGGSGFTLGTVAKPSIGVLIGLGGGSNITIEKGTTITFNNAITNIFNAIGGFSANAFPTNLTNKGIINIQGSSARSGAAFSTGSKDVASVYNIINEGTFNINFNAVTRGTAAFLIGNGGGGGANEGSVVNLTNSGMMMFKNTSTAVGTGFSIFTVSAGEAPKLLITNSGTLDLEGSSYNYGLKTTISNSGILNTNNELRAFSATNNNVGGTINFVKNATTGLSRQVTFIVPDITETGGVGSIYRDSSNKEYVVMVQKYKNIGNELVASILSGTMVAPTGTLTRVSTPAGTATIDIEYSTVTIPALNNAMGRSSNSGIINTGAGSDLNIINAITETTATSIFSPGGNTKNGILQFNEVTADALSLAGTLRMQASGNTTEGVDFDAIHFTGTLDIIDISAATLDLTGIYVTGATKFTIDIITTNTTKDFEGAILGEFASVIAPKGWKVIYTTGFGNKVQLEFDPALTTTQFAQAKFNYFPNPSKGQLNLVAAKSIDKVELYNVLGQKVLTNVVKSTEKQVDISTLKTGIYMMEVTIDNTKQSFKVVKE